MMTEWKTEALKASPIVVTNAPPALLGLPLPTWLMIGTGIYTVLLIAEKLWKLYRMWREGRNKNKE
jgi:hypothetical protein